jgi:hypothetical protein
LCEYFGLTAQGSSPKDKGWKDIDKWWIAHADDYKKMCEEYGLRPREILPQTWSLLSAGFTFLGRDREMSLYKIRGLGFREEYPVGHGYFRVFERLVEERIIVGKESWSR